MRNQQTNSDGDVVRFSRPERHQWQFQEFCLDQLVGEHHQVRSLWEYVCSLDLRPFCREYRAVSGRKGRRPVPPEILLTLWLFATIEGITSGRRLAKLCKRDAVFKWICGEVSVNRNLLNEFRVSHAEALQAVMSETLALLQLHGLIDFQRVSQDGMRVRANAGKSSFRKKDTLEELLNEANERVERVLTEIDDPGGNDRNKAAELAAAEDRLNRIEEALRQHEELAAKREKRKKGDGETTRVSTTDPDARNMKMADGGFRPALNVQAATLNDSRLLVSIDISQEGTDSRQMGPMLETIEETFGVRPKEILVDGGFNSHHDVTEVESQGTEVYAPVRKARNSDNDPYAPHRGDSPEVIRWRARMKTDEAQLIYKERCSTAEFPFARFRNFGLYQSPVRGATRLKPVAILHSIAHNFQQLRALSWLPRVVAWAQEI